MCFLRLRLNYTPINSPVMIFFEKQEGQLCAQHALNALLQGPYFTAPDLAEIARSLDNKEKAVYSQGNPQGQDFLKQFQFLQYDSHNMDDSGFFSIQVIGEALKIWNLEMVPYMSTSDDQAMHAQLDPTIYVVKGMLPNCEADNLAEYQIDAILNSNLSTKNPLHSNASLNDASSSDVTASLDVDDGEDHDDLTLKRTLAMSRLANDAEDSTLQRALAQSLAESGGVSTEDPCRDEEDDLKLAVEMSLAGAAGAGAAGAGADRQDEGKPKICSTHSKPLSIEELRQRRLAYLEKSQSNKPSGSDKP